MMGSLNTQEDLDLDIIDTSLLSQERLNQFLKESVITYLTIKVLLNIATMQRYFSKKCMLLLVDVMRNI